MTSKQYEFDRYTAGTYLPRAFTVTMLHKAIKKLPHAGPLTIPKAAFPTFMHEFAHLIQDWSTFRGVMDFLNVWDQITAVADHVARSGKTVPYPLVQTGGKLHRLTPRTLYALELDQLSAMTEPVRRWTKDERSWKFESHEEARFGLPLAGRKVEDRFVLAHLVEETTKEKYTHRLGAWEIKEAYSVAVGLLHGGKPKQVGKMGFEYMAVERILAHYFDDVTPLQTIALCHWAIQDLSPATTLFALIERFASPQRRLPSPSEIYREGWREAMARGFADNCRDIVKTLEETAAGHAAYGNTNVESLFRWYAQQAGGMLEIQLDEKQEFPLDTFLCVDSRDMHQDDRAKGMRSLFELIQLPLLIWPDGSTYTIRADEEAQGSIFLNRCVVDLLGKVWRGKNPEWRCPVYHACDLPLREKHDCRRWPWKKGWVHPTCPYGAASKLFGIQSGQSFELKPFGKH